MTMLMVWDRMPLALRLMWMPVLVRGKLHLELLPEAFPGECAEGATMAIERIPVILNGLFRGDAKPRVLMTDRGKGFYHGSGRITDEYAAALATNGLRPLMGHDRTGRRSGTIVKASVVGILASRPSQALQ